MIESDINYIGETNGIGTYFYENNDIFHGYLSNGIPNGYGEFWHNGKLIYTGNFKNATFHGYGHIFGIYGLWQFGVPIETYIIVS